MDATVPHLSPEAIDAVLERLSASAARGCGLVDTLYEARLMEAIDGAAWGMSVIDADALLARAAAHHGYVPADQRVPITADGSCPCGLDEMTCPNGHFEGHETADEGWEDEAWLQQQSMDEQRWDAEAMNYAFDTVAAARRFAAAITERARAKEARSWRGRLRRLKAWAWAAASRR